MRDTPMHLIKSYIRLATGVTNYDGHVLLVTTDGFLSNLRTFDPLVLLSSWKRSLNQVRGLTPKYHFHQRTSPSVMVVYVACC